MLSDFISYKEVLNNLNMGIFILDVMGNYLYVNDAYCKMVNKSNEFYKNMSVPKLKEQGYIKDSVWEEVLRKNDIATALLKVTDNQLQQMYHLFITGIPIYSEDMVIKCVIFIAERMEQMNQRIQEGILNRFNYKDQLIISQTNSTQDIIAESSSMKQLLSLISNVAKTDATVLISGPTGSGKEVIANHVHKLSNRNQSSIISVDCTSIPENLLESELFGYSKGAFTGALSHGKQGLLELANHGTLFLDEINSMPLNLQAKLLRVLETKKIKRIGDNTFRLIDFRLICASNQSLEELVIKGEFRSDLYYRINVVPITISPLCERKEDILPLTFYFLQFFCKKYMRMKVLSEEMLHYIKTYSWPGNVRELKNFIESIVVTTSSSDIQIDTVPNQLLHEIEPSPKLADSQDVQYDMQLTYRQYMDHHEKQLFQMALKEYGSPAKVAEVLKLDLSNVYRKLKKHQIDLNK